ncbi:Diaminopimelate epimerase [Buchnera aphidicola (Panaphis juglandis)]
MSFSKMHGLGNDFIVFDKINQNFLLNSSIIQKISNRNTGIGCDQVLIVEKSNNIKFDFYYRIFNSDGSEASQCGNGARCFAYFVYLKKLTQKKSIIVKTKYNSLLINIIDKDNIIVNMGKPLFNINNIPNFSISNFQIHDIKVDNNIFYFSEIFIGNPHCVILVKDIDHAPVDTVGSFLNQNSRFKNGVNVNFMKIISSNHIMLRVYERGVGETQACGSGACASVVSGIIQNVLKKDVIVELMGGVLKISWGGFNHSVYMNGPAKHVYDGYINYSFLYS